VGIEPTQRNSRYTTTDLKSQMPVFRKLHAGSQFIPQTDVLEGLAHYMPCNQGTQRESPRGHQPVTGQWLFRWRSEMQ